MEKKIYSIITATGKYIPTLIVKNSDFLNNVFYDSKGQIINKTNEEIISKFQEITQISERRYIEDKYVTSDIAYFAAEDALQSGNINREELDYIIVAHNFGDVRKDNPKTDIVPTIAARVKQRLGIENPYTIAYDLPFGCPGWLQAVIQANYYIQSGDAKKILVIGAEALSRISDPHDIDSMIYSDGAGAVVLEAIESESPIGILAHKTRSDTLNHAQLLRMDVSYNPNYGSDRLFLKMEGRKLYEYALTYVPQLVKETIEKAGISITDIKKVLIHQANEKMDDAILSRLLKLYSIKIIPEHIMPMTISLLGNNSVATLPILVDKIIKEEMPNHIIESNDYIVFASVGAGMNVNSVVYKVQ
ncbi:MAG: 3-oxoacyl-ACP synthase III family protein [Candidatus Kapaibacteriota bacterium]